MDGLRGEGLEPLSLRDMRPSAAGGLRSEPAGEGLTEEPGDGRLPCASPVGDKVDGLLGNDPELLRRRDARSADESRAQLQGEGPTDEPGDSESGRLCSVSSTTSCGGCGAARLANQP